LQHADVVSIARETSGMPVDGGHLSSHQCQNISQIFRNFTA